MMKKYLVAITLSLMSFTFLICGDLQAKEEVKTKAKVLSFNKKESIYMPGSVYVYRGYNRRANKGHNKYTKFSLNSVILIIDKKDISKYIDFLKKANKDTLLMDFKNTFSKKKVQDTLT